MPVFYFTMLFKGIIPISNDRRNGKISLIFLLRQSFCRQYFMVFFQSIWQFFRGKRKRFYNLSVFLTLILMLICNVKSENAYKNYVSSIINRSGYMYKDTPLISQFKAILNHNKSSNAHQEFRKHFFY